MNTSVLSKRIAGQAELFFKRHGPEILTAAGVAGFIATNYLTARAVMKSQKKIELMRARTEEIKSRAEDDGSNRKEIARELGETVVRDGLSVMKDFGPAIATGTVSIICIVTAHGMMRRRQTAIMAAYTALETGFRMYRNKIAEELGPDRELEIYRGMRVKGIPDGEEGPFEIELNDKRPSPYAFFFDESSTLWSKDPEYNKMTLRQVENWANERLQAYGFVFLNEVLEGLGMKRCQMGQVVGWLLKGDGDGFVSFGIYDIFDESSRAFVNGFENVVLLDFNCDGKILI